MTTASITEKITPPGSFGHAKALPMLALVLALLVVSLVVSCAENLNVNCCQQCTAAASQDPAGMDISGKDCRGYDQKLTKECRNYFEENLRTMGECRLAA